MRVNNALFLWLNGITQRDNRDHGGKAVEVRHIMRQQVPNAIGCHSGYNIRIMDLPSTQVGRSHQCEQTR